MAGKIQLQKSLQKPYERRLFAGEVLTAIFQNRIQILSSPLNETANLTTGEAALMQQVLQYGKIVLDDGTPVTCYEITLHNHVRLEQNKISIQQYVRKLLVTGEVMLINFIQNNSPHFWRLSLISSDTKITDSGDIQAFKTNAKRYTYLLGESETCLTAAAQMVVLEGKANIVKKDLVDAFSVEKVSKPFFEEYTKIHYKRFNEYLIASNFRASVFNGDEKAIRDFVKKLLGRIVFLYFVQKKGWLGCRDATGWDSGDRNFITNLFKKSGGDDAFYPVWLSTLFFDTLNAPRPNDGFTMPDKSTVRIPFLNGGLFEKDKHDNSLITFPPAMFHNALNAETDKERGFLDFLDAYNFTVYEDSPDDHTVAVDPEMLGHIFENLLEDNKDKGTFYTPKEIVHYMCQESLVEYLGTKLTSNPTGKIEMGKSQADMFGNASRKGQLALETPVEDKPTILVQRTDIEDLIKNNRVNEGLQKYLKTIDKYLDDVRICDPAIGSGAFPMGLLHEIFNAKMLLYVAMHNTVPTPEQRVDIKLHIIQNSIYGVDIERGAVDIAQLRFWLSLIVDEQSPKALPNLDYKIVVGNSLVSKFEDDVITIDWEVKEGTQTDIFGGNIIAEKRVDLLKKISQKQHAYFLPENHNKKEIAGQIRNLKIDLLMNQLELMVKNTGINSEPKLESYKTKTVFMKAQEVFLQMMGWQKTIQQLKSLKAHPEKPFNHFDWKLDFPEILNPALVGEKTGFDIVIGNPPYGAKLDHKDVLKSIYPNTSHGNIDSYKYFIDKALQTIKREGCLIFITSDSYLEKEYFYDLRKLIISCSSKIINIKLGDDIFGSAKIPTSILMTSGQKNNQLNTYFSDVSNFLLSERINFIASKLNKIELNTTHFNFSDSKTNFLNKCNHPKLIDLFEQVMGVEVYQIGKGKPKQTSKEVDSNCFISTEKEGDEWIEFIDSGIKRYKLDSETKYIHYGEWLAEPRDLKYFMNPKIILREIVNPRVFAQYIERDTIVKNTNAVIIEKDDNDLSLKYLLSILNSQLFTYYVFENSPKSGNRLFPSINSHLIKNFPIPQISFIVQKPFIEIVDKILAGKKSGLATDAWEAEIDRLVYELYELSAAEIAVVEGQ